MVSELSSVEDAKALAVVHCKELKAFKKSQAQTDQLDQLKEMQKHQREKFESEMAERRERHEQVMASLGERQLSQRSAMTSGYLAEARDIRKQREGAQPQGLAGFLARASGLEAVRKQLHKYQDGKRHSAFLDQRRGLREQQRDERGDQQRRHDMHMLDMERKRRALDFTHEREQKSLQSSFVQQHRVRARKGIDHMPALTLDLKPPGRHAVLHKAANRYTSPLAREMRKSAEPNPKPEPVNLQRDFEQAVRPDVSQSAGDGSGKSPSNNEQSSDRTPIRDNSGRGR